MLTTAVSTTAAATTAAASSMMATMGISEYGILAVIGLIALLSAKEVLSASNKLNHNISNMLNISIYPLLVSFFAIVVYKVIAVV